MNYEKQFQKVFDALTAHQNEFLAALEQRIREESADNNFDDDFNVAVRLVRNDEKISAFLPIKSDSDLIFGEDETPEHLNCDCFIDAGYDELDSFCEQIFRGLAVTVAGTKNFRYTLRRHDKFIRAEKILADVAAMYKIRRPVIFSPFARKAVEIFVEGIDPQEVISLDFQEQTQGLRLIRNAKLCWNVKISDVDTNLGGDVEEYFGSDGQLIRYEYFHTFDRDAKIFVLPNQHCDDVHISLGDERQIRLGYNSVLKTRVCRQFEFTDVEISDDTFTNDFPLTNPKLRLRTAGDFERVLACFNATRCGQKFPSHFVKGNPSKKLVTVYRREDRYHVATENLLLGNLRDKPICFVSFGGDSIFKTDYVNFVLAYLAQNYPEFSWAGVDP